LQFALRTQSPPAAYIAKKEWCAARLPACPLHPQGGCSFARHGSYPRVTPQGVRIARWYCPEGHRTFSLLPDFLAARLPGLLSDIESVLLEAKSARSLEAAADTLRGFAVTLPSALRWLRRRIRAIEAGLQAFDPLSPELPISVLACLPARRSDLCGLRQALPRRFSNGCQHPPGLPVAPWSRWSPTRQGA